jgi:hypothetical protein
MLGLLASILSWSYEERVRAGLQMGNNPASANSLAPPRPLELENDEKTDETEVRGTALPTRDGAKELFSHSPVSG